MSSGNGSIVALRPQHLSHGLTGMYSLECVFERHGYPWVPTDQGLRGPCQVDPTCQKPHRPTSGPGDLIHNPDDLGRPRATLSRSGRTRQACGARLSPRLRLGAASRSADHGIHHVLMEDDLSSLVTDPDEGPPTSDGSPSLLTIYIRWSRAPFEGTSPFTNNSTAYWT
jgi:hypothetical protein